MNFDKCGRAELFLRSKVYRALHDYAGRTFAEKRTDEILNHIAEVVELDLFEAELAHLSDSPTVKEPKT